jgi:hypothetical protein
MDIMSYTKGVIPLIILGCLMITLCLFSLLMLLSDLLEKGCLSWHRDSIGILLQKTIFSLCFLLSSVYLYKYVNMLEHVPPEYQSNIIRIIEVQTLKGR